MLNAKTAARRLSRRFPRAFDLLLAPRVAPVRRLVTSRIPGLAEAIASIYFFRGSDSLARSELETKDGSLRDGVVAARIRELEVAQQGHNVSDPRPAETQHQNELDPARVVHALDNSLVGSSGGYAHRSHVLLKALKLAQIHPTALTRPGYPRFATNTDVLTEEARLIDGIEYRSISPGSNVYERTSEFEYIALYADELARAAQASKAPIIHAHSNYLNGLAAAWAASRLGRASIYEVRGLWHLTRAALEPAFAKTRLYAYQEYMEVQAMLQVDRVIVPSQAMAEWLVEKGLRKERISVVSYSANLTIITPMAKDLKLSSQLRLDGRFVLGFVGSVTAYEGLDTVLKAVALCAERGLDVVAVVVGDGPAMAAVKQLAARLGIADRLVTTGRKPLFDVPSFYSIFDICPVIRRNVEVCKVVTPLKPAEIMAAGKPMIVSALPPLLDYGEEGKSRISVLPDDHESLADCIMDLSRDRDRLTSLGAEARQWAVRNLDDRKIGDRYASIYREVLEMRAT